MPRNVNVKGNVTSWNSEKGIGIISAEDGRSLFVHFSEMCQHIIPQRGESPPENLEVIVGCVTPEPTKRNDSAKEVQCLECIETFVEKKERINSYKKIFMSLSTGEYRNLPDPEITLEVEGRKFRGELIFKNGGLYRYWYYVDHDGYDYFICDWFVTNCVKEVPGQNEWDNVSWHVSDYREAILRFGYPDKIYWDGFDLSA